MPRILVIDDSSFQRHRLRVDLEAAGFEVEDWVPMSSLEVLERIRRSTLDLVLSDYAMPDVDGLSVLKMVKRANPGLPVVILTAIRDPDREERLIQQGARCVLNKPISSEALIQVLNRVLTEAGGSRT
jgi:CheY-like chemotaxis protein